jgi:hypothetical protein
VSRHLASLGWALILPALAGAGVTAAAYPPTPPPHRGMPTPPSLISPLPPALELSSITPVREPRADEDYLVNVTVTNIGSDVADDVRLSLRLSPDLTLPGSPAGCVETYGIPAPALECDWARLSAGASVTVPLVVRAVRAGDLVAVGSILRYDWGLWAYANIIRIVECAPAPAPPPPPPTPSPPRPTPPPSRRPVPPPPATHAPRPAAPARPPAPPPSQSSQAPAPARVVPKPKPKPKPRPTPSPQPTPFNHVEELPLIPSANPKPVIPLGILIAVVLTPCVAAAATRFGKR